MSQQLFSCQLKYECLSCSHLIINTHAVLLILEFSTELAEFTYSLNIFPTSFLWYSTKLFLLQKSLLSQGKLPIYGPSVCGGAIALAHESRKQSQSSARISTTLNEAVLMTAGKTCFTWKTSSGEFSYTDSNGTTADCSTPPKYQTVVFEQHFLSIQWRYIRAHILMYVPKILHEKSAKCKVD